MLDLLELKNKNTNELLDVIQSLRQEASEWLILSEENDTLIKEKKEDKALIANLQETIRLLKHGKFGVSSERYVDNILQGCLFDEAVLPENTADIEQTEAVIQVPTHARKQAGRKPLPKDLPRQEIIYDLEASERICSCARELHLIGDERTEQLDIIPAKIQVIEHIQKKYACRFCKTGVKLAKKPKQPITKTLRRTSTITPHIRFGLRRFIGFF